MTTSDIPSPQPDDGGAAFPDQYTDGMTLRDYFAAHASDDDVRDQAEILRADLLKARGVGILPDNWRTAARYMHADAMLKARGGAA